MTAAQGNTAALALFALGLLLLATGRRLARQANARTTDLLLVDAGRS